MTSLSCPNLAKPRIHKPDLVTVFALIVTLVAVITSVVFAKNHRSNAAWSNRTKSVAATSSVINEPSDMQALLFEVRPFGFISSEITVPAGRYVIVLNNRTGRSDLTFRLDRENEGRISASTPNRRDWKQQVILRPGNYIISEVNNPSWTCLIRVTS